MLGRSDEGSKPELKQLRFIPRTWSKGENRSTNERGFTLVNHAFEIEIPLKTIKRLDDALLEMFSYRFDPRLAKFTPDPSEMKAKNNAGETSVRLFLLRYDHTGFEIDFSPNTGGSGLCP
jgi:hypothetical protein